MASPFIYGIQPDGKLLWYLHEGQADGTFHWHGPNEIGTGWDGFITVFSGDNGVIYTLQELSRDPITGMWTGGLLWYRHNGQADGTFDWQGPKNQGRKWNNYSTLFSGGNGIIYAIQEDSRDPITGMWTGGLHWYCHEGQVDGTPNWIGPKTVGHGWSGFSKVFSGGNGVIYAIQDNGNLLWYRHDGYTNGSFRWAEGSGKIVGTGWDSFSSVFASGDGVIYGIVEASRDPVTGAPTGGQLFWYRHDGYMDGSPTWQGPNTVGKKWEGFNKVFSAVANSVIANTGDGSFCGIPENGGDIRIQTYGSPAGRWSRGNLKVSINTAGAIFVNATPAAPNPVSVIMAAFNQWQTPPPPFPPSFFNFTFVPPGTGEDIRVIFGGSGVDSRFGQPGGTLASADYPEQGNLQFDSIELWNPNLLLATALHEIGHLLGLTHSNTPGGTMNPFVRNALTIDTESRTAIAALYGWEPQKRRDDAATSHRASIGVTSVTNFGSTSETLHMVWKGIDGDSTMYHSEFSNNDWTPQNPIPGVGCSFSPSLTQITVPGSPILAVGLLMAWRGIADDASHLYWTRNMGTGWEGQRGIPGVGSSSAPALASVTVNNGGIISQRICMAWKGIQGDSAIYWSIYDGAEGWSPQQQILGTGTSDSPALVGFNGILYMFWKGIEDDANAYYSSFDFINNPIWKPRRTIEYFSYETGGGVPCPIGTSGALSAVVRGNSILLTWKGVEGDSNIYFSLFENNEFSGQAAVPNVGTSVGPSVVQAFGRTFMAWKGIEGDSNIYWTRL
jgi:hypothetical protein